MHDINGRPLALGDQINIPCTITRLGDSAEFCNVDVASIHLMPPYADESGRLTISALNTKQCELRLPAALTKITSGDITGTDLSARDLQILEDKNLRVQIDALIDNLRKSPFKSPERTLAFRQLQLAKAWLGFDLQELGTPNPYPNSRDTSNTVVDPTADVAHPPEFRRLTKRELQIEERAKVIYDQMRQGDPDGEKTPWVDGGNSLKQQEARTEAIKRLTEESGQTQAGG